MKKATVKRLKLLSKHQKVENESSRRKKWNYCYKVWRKGKPIYEIAKYDYQPKVSKEYVNLIERPITLREITHLYSNYAHLFGFRRTKLHFNEDFAYFVMLNHYEDEFEKVLARNIDPNFIYGVEYKTPNTKSAYELVSYLRDLVDITDRYNNGEKKLLPYICAKKKAIKNCINKWFSELELIDGISPEDRLKSIIK